VVDKLYEEVYKTEIPLESYTRDMIGLRTRLYGTDDWGISFRFLEGPQRILTCLAICLWLTNVFPNEQDLLLLCD